MWFDKVRGIIFLGLLVMLSPTLRAAPSPHLDVVVGGSTRTISVASLQSVTPSQSLPVFNPVYKRLMTYEGFWLDEVLTALSIQWKDKDVVVQCADGYATSITPEEVGRHQWLLAFQEKGGGWTPLPEHKPEVLPAPWYLVGGSPDSFKTFPWPYNVVRMKIESLW